MKKVIMVLAFALAGCAGEKPLYEWGNYSSVLLAKYKGNISNQEYSDRLRANISKLESENKKVPPGLYSEYGFALLELGNERAALREFSKEKEHYPEAAAFIDRISGRLQAQKAKSTDSAAPDAAQPSPDVEQAPAVAPEAAPAQDTQGAPTPAQTPSLF
ncbi:MAG: DUF4810 domain-containing protein [Sphingomonadales bacterium]|nr:MAG: DUF4810 domain-containing protein [Sphingomonadales bacterium]